MGFLKFLFIAILVLWLIRMVVRLLAPWILKKVSQKIMGTAQQQYQQRQRPQQGNHTQTQPEGEISIDYVPPQAARPKKGPQKAGEFVDFEEVK